MQAGRSCCNATHLYACLCVVVSHVRSEGCGCTYSHERAHAPRRLQSQAFRALRPDAQVKCALNVANMVLCIGASAFASYVLLLHAPVAPEFAQQQQLFALVGLLCVLAVFLCRPRACKGPSSSYARPQDHTASVRDARSYAVATFSVLGVLFGYAVHDLWGTRGSWFTVVGFEYFVHHWLMMALVALPLVQR